jgi:peptidyl-prolyl cis-trans isomerase SurA
MKFIRKTSAVVGLLLVLTTLALPTSAEVIDRIVATVNGHIILQSDWNDALRFEALLSARSLSDFNEQERRDVLDRLIDQELLSEQMKSASFQHASDTEATDQVAAARKLYPEAATDAGWNAVLDKFGVTDKSLLSHVKEQIDLMRLVDAHLRPTVQIDSKSVEAYYREKFVPQLKQSGADEVPLEDVSAKIRELLTEEKVNELMVSWLQSLRSESKVSLPGMEGSPREGVQTP